MAASRAEAGTSAERRSGGLGALRYRSFCLYWFGSIASNIGSWMQVVATGWLVLQLSNSASDLGITAAFQGVPIVLFALVGGVVADRLNRYWLMVGSQAAIIVPDAILAVLVATNHARVEHVYVYSLITGVLNGVSNPARRSLVPHLVKREALLSAMALDSTVWNGAAIIGPSLAGLAIAGWGLGAPFYVNVASDVIAIVVLLPIRDRAPHIEHTTSPWQNVGEGLRYAWDTKSVRWLLLLMAATSFFGRSFIPLAPLFARDVFHAGPQGLGILTTMPAIGTVCASVALALSATSASRKWFLAAATCLCVFLVAYAISPGLGIAVIVLLAVGASGSLAQTLANTLLQQTVEERMRGRVMSLFMASTLGAWRLAALPFGFAAQQWGAPIATAAGAIVLLLCLLPSLPMIVDRSYSFSRRWGKRESLDKQVPSSFAHVPLENPGFEER